MPQRDPLDTSNPIGSTSWGAAAPWLAALSPAVAADAQMYVAVSGADVGDGRSWGSAKRTINAAIAALPSGGGTIHVGPGDHAAFTLTSPNNRIRIIGHGAARILVTGAGPGITIDGSSSTPVVGPLIENIHVQGDGAAGTTTGIRLLNAKRCVLRQLRVSDCLIGIEYKNDAGGFTERNLLQSTLINNCGTGIYFNRTASGSSSFSYNDFYEVGVDQFTTIGINIADGAAAVPDLFGSHFVDVVVWGQQNNNVGVAIAANMTNVSMHIIAERQAGSTTTGFDVKSTATTPNSFFLTGGFVGAWTTPIALAAGKSLRFLQVRDSADLRAAGEGSKGETFPRVLAQGTVVLTAGTITAGLVSLRRGDLVSNILVSVNTNSAGATLTKAGIYSKTGTRLALSADVSGAFNAGATPRVEIIPLITPYVVQDDDVFYLAFLSVGSAPAPDILRGINLAAHNSVIAGGVRPDAQIAAGGQTDLPAGPSSINAQGAAPWLAWS